MLSVCGQLVLFLGEGPCTPHAHTMLSKFSLDRASAAASAQVSDGVYSLVVLEQFHHFQVVELHSIIQGDVATPEREEQRP